MTGVLNRRGFEEEFHREWTRSVLYRSDFSVIMIDIDDFKKYNDAYGHVEGDKCLIQVAKTIEKSLRRPFDTVARMEEKSLLLFCRRPMSKAPSLWRRTFDSRLKPCRLKIRMQRDGIMLRPVWAW